MQTQDFCPPRSNWRPDPVQDVHEGQMYGGKKKKSTAVTCIRVKGNLEIDIFRSKRDLLTLAHLR